MSSIIPAIILQISNKTRGHNTKSNKQQ